MRPLPSLPESDYSQVDTPTSKEWAIYDYEEDVYSTPETTIYATIEGGRVITVTLHVDIERPREKTNQTERKESTKHQELSHVHKLLLIQRSQLQPSGTPEDLWC